jgi:hypothetical protein
MHTMQRVGSTTRDEANTAPQSWLQSLEQVIQFVLAAIIRHSCRFRACFLMLRFVVRAFEQVVERHQRGEDRHTNMQV